jgi:hypothetical protein
MRSLFVAAATALALAASSLLPQEAHAQATLYGGSLSLPIDTSVRVGFAGSARDVVIGNPMIADVTLLESGGAIILGKEYGLTSITAFDAAGRTVFSRQVVVVAGTDNRVAYFRGAQQNNYVCADGVCERTPMPGEPGVAYNETANSYSGYSGRARQAAQANGRGN